jgi:hypothetical protein
MKEYYRPSKLIASSFSVSRKNLNPLFIGLLAVYTVQIVVNSIELSPVLSRDEYTYHFDRSSVPLTRSNIYPASCGYAHQLPCFETFLSSFLDQYQKLMEPHNLIAFCHLRIVPEYCATSNLSCKLFGIHSYTSDCEISVRMDKEKETLKRSKTSF